MYGTNNVHLIWVNRKSVAYLSHGGPPPPTWSAHPLTNDKIFFVCIDCTWFRNNFTFLLPTFMHLTRLRMDSGSPSLPSRWNRLINIAPISNSDCCNDFGFSTSSLSVLGSLRCTRYFLWDCFSEFSTSFINFSVSRFFFLHNTYRALLVVKEGGGVKCIFWLPNWIFLGQVVQRLNSTETDFCWQSTQ